MIRHQLDQLEIQGKWAEALRLASQHPESVDAMCRCIFYGWYLLLEAPCIDPEPESAVIKEANKLLVSLVPTALTSGVPALVREVGYGMNIAAYLFPGNTNENEASYSAVLKKAMELDPQDPLSVALYNGSLSEGPVVPNLLDQADWSQYIDQTFPGEGEYDRYYRSVLKNREIGEQNRPNH